VTSPSLDFAGLQALFINCTLKRSPEPSNTQGLVDISTAIMEKHGVSVDIVRAVDHDIATGVWPDMREHGWATDDWPNIFEKVLAADILVLAGPIWLGDNSSVMKKVHERLYGGSHLLNDAGQYLYYGRVGGCLITGKKTASNTVRRTCSTRCSTSATRFHRKPTLAGLAKRGRDRPTWTPAPADRRTTSPIATPLS
jgi:multimeric flavodoxin WrbA